MANPIDSQIRSRIDSFLAEMTTLVRQSALEAVREALGNGAVPARRGPGRPKGSGAGNGRKRVGRRAKGGKRSADYLDKVGELVLAYVRANHGQGSEAIGRELGLSSKDMALPIRKLIAEKKLRTEGQRRGTKYFAGGGRGSGKGRRKEKASRKGVRKGARKAKRGRKGSRAGGRKKAASANGSAASETTAAA